MAFTSSWDDGHPLDLRLAELLHRHGFAGTFYIPLRNEFFGLPVLESSQIRELAALAEVASHTHDHLYLTTLDDSAAKKQIQDGKTALEQILGQPVAGFSYPGGKFTRAHQAMVKGLGFQYARTTVNFHGDVAQDRYLMPTSLQFYPHSRPVYVRNWLRHEDRALRYRLARIAVSSSGLLSCLRSILQEVQAQGGVFHLWGHSWEFDQFGGWKLLDEFLRFAADIVPSEHRVANRACF
jgi:peptidoglycan/xylan/chitin deacetylase (PgdA/CDA1 family)